MARHVYLVRTGDDGVVGVFGGARKAIDEALQVEGLDRFVDYTRDRHGNVHLDPKPLTTPLKLAKLVSGFARTHVGTALELHSTGDFTTGVYIEVWEVR